MPTHLIDHHIVYYRCPKTVDKNVYDNLIGKVFPCYNYSHPLQWVRAECSEGLISTSIYSEAPILFPRNVGMEWEPEYSYFVYEAHLVNPTDDEQKVNTAIRLWMTSESLVFA